jgi:hypothetical protein
VVYCGAIYQANRSVRDRRPAGGHFLENATAPTTSIEDAKALDLLKASGVLNPDVTLDKLMQVSHQLAQLAPETANKIFMGHFYIYMKVGP